VDEHRNEPNSEHQAAGGAAPTTPEASSQPTEAAVADATAAQATAEPAEKPAETPAKTPGGDQLRIGKITIMAPARDQSWTRHWDDEIEVEAPDAPEQPASQPYGARRLMAVAAAVILAAVAGAIGGALASAGLSHFGESAASATQAKALDAQVAQLQTELATLKAGIDHANKLSVAGIAKASDRLDRVEKAQAEPAAKIAKLTETVEKLRVAQAQPTPAVAAVASQEVTGSIAAKPPAAPQPEVGRLPTVEGWTLRDVEDGVALIEGKRGRIEVYPGDNVPGLGRIDAVRRQDGRWVVVTSRGLIVAR
jgi:hypothetical protein